MINYQACPCYSGLLYEDNSVRASDRYTETQIDLAFTSAEELGRASMALVS